jgi:hypothetical protein
VQKINKSPFEGFKTSHVTPETTLPKHTQTARTSRLINLQAVPLPSLTGSLLSPIIFGVHLFDSPKGPSKKLKSPKPRNPAGPSLFGHLPQTDDIVPFKKVIKTVAPFHSFSPWQSRIFELEKSLAKTLNTMNTLGYFSFVNS